MRFPKLILSVLCVGLLSSCAGQSTADSNGELYRPGQDRDGASKARLTRSSKKTRRASKYGPRDRVIRAKYDKVINGMTYDEVVEIMGKPSKKQTRYGWTTVEGQVWITFDWEGQMPQRVSKGPGVSSERYQALQRLVAQGANYNRIAAHLGSEPDNAAPRTAVWRFLPAGRARITLDNDFRVVSKGWRRR